MAAFAPLRGHGRRQPDRRALLRILPVLALGLAGCATVRRELPRVVTPFSAAAGPGRLPPGWEELVMRHDLPETQYRIAELEGRRMLLASGSGASGLRHRLQADPVATPWLQWSWRTREVPPGMSVAEGGTDDSPARIAVAFGGDEHRLPERDRNFNELVQLITGERLPYASLMYVWDGRLPPESVVRNSRTGRIRYLVVETGGERAGQWLHYERNLLQDFRRVFGEEPGPVESVGVMTDGDDLKVELETWYGDIRLQAVAARGMAGAETASPP